MILPDGFVIHKIGMTNTSRSTDRMMEILRSWFTRYRFVPYSELKLDMECTCPAELEKHLHKILARKQFLPNEDVDGKTEMFCDIDETRILHYIRNYNHELITNLKLQDEDYTNLCQLISP